MAIVFTCIVPHPPIILPGVGSSKERIMVKKTIDALEKLRKKLKELKPDLIIISSPHPDWGFNVPLCLLVRDFKVKTERYLINLESPQSYFKKGKGLYKLKIKNSKLKIALVASGDLSHCLKIDGPYGFHPDGPEFDKTLIKSLKKKDIETILKLDKIYPQAAECGLRSFCFLLGVLQASGINWQAEILSYENPFGVGYLVSNFKL